MSKIKKNTTQKSSFFDKMEFFLQKNNSILFWIIFVTTALVAIGLFDPRVSLTGDDSAYIIQTNDLIKQFKFPSFQGPLYPLALAPIVLIFGISLFPLKLFSLLSMLGFMYFTFAAFRKRIPAVLLLPTLLLVSINSFVLYYASQTYSEAFYMFMQSLVIFVFFRYFIDADGKEITFKTNLKSHLWLALAVLGVALSRSVGFSVFIAVLAYFLFYKQWKNLLYAAVCFICFFGLYSLLKGLIWNSGQLQFADQGSSLLNKDFYHPENGKEDIVGMLVRFWQNSVQYLSNGLFRTMGFSYEMDNNSVFRTLVVYALAFGGLFFSFKKNRYLFFTIIVAGVFIVVTFFALQVFWNQERLIIPAYPLILLSIFGCFYYVLSLEKLRAFQFLYIIPIIILFFAGIKDTAEAIPEARKITNQYSGLTPDWVNYMRSSDWASKNLKESDLVAARKPTISTVYGNGKSFYGIFKVPSGNSKWFIQEWSANQNKYIALPINEQNYNHFSKFQAEYQARLELGNSGFWVLNNSENVIQTLSEINVQATPFEQIKKLSNSAGDNFGIFYPDSLLAPFREKGVTHIMTASLRINPNQKTGQTISTVERYAFYIQEKYPTIFEFVYQEGKPENEPATIYKINWDVVK